MTSNRHLIDDDLYSDIQRVGRNLLYKQRGQDSWQKMIRKLLAYAESHPDIFRN